MAGKTAARVQRVNEVEAAAADSTNTWKNPRTGKLGFDASLVTWLAHEGHGR